MIAEEGLGLELAAEAAEAVRAAMGTADAARMTYSACYGVAEKQNTIHLGRRLSAWLDQGRTLVR